MSKKKTFFVGVFIILAAVIGGACGYFGIAYLKAGGTAEGTMAYIEKTVIPALIPAVVFIVASIVAAQPIIGKIQVIITKVYAVISSFNKASDAVDGVKVNGTLSLTALNDAKSEIAGLKADFTEIKSMMADTCKQYERIKSGLEIAFTNNAELVKNGYAKQIYNVLEGKNEEKT